MSKFLNRNLKPLSNIDFDNLLKDNPYYGWCGSKDKVSSKNCKDGKIYVLNMDKESGRGNHWMMMSLADDNINLYYDSYAAKPPLRVENFLKSQSKPYIINPNYEAEQSLNSSSCGYFCLFYILLLTKLNFKPQEIIDLLKDDVIKNEKLMYIFSKEVLKKLKQLKSVKE